MQVLVINGSPAGKNSITLQTVRYLELCFPEDTFEVLNAAQQIRMLEKEPERWTGPVEKADLLLFCYPVYTFLVPAQLHRFLELVRESGMDLAGKWATQLSTSMHFYDTTAHRFIRDACDDLGMRYITGLSAGMEDLLKKEGQEDAEAFWRYVRWSVETGSCERPQITKDETKTVLQQASVPEERKKDHAGSVAVVADLSNDADGRLAGMIRRFSAQMDREVRIADIGQFAFQGGCLGCFHCAADGTCIYKDGFDAYLRGQIQTADAIVYAFTIRDHSMGYRMKLFDDRQFCNGHRTVTMGRPVAYLIDGALSREENLHTLIEARAQVGGNCLAGVATDEGDTDAQIDGLVKRLIYAADSGYLPPKNFWGVGGMKVFRDLIWQMQGLMREDHRFYKKHGFYDFPQKKRGRMIAMYAVGGMMRSRMLQKKIGGRMTEGMLMPYEKLLKKKEKQMQEQG